MVIGTPIKPDELYELAADEELLAEVEDLYRQLAQEIDEQRPACIGRGLCCHFDDYGHRMFATSAEWAFVISSGRLPAPPPESKGQCPFQSGRLCTLRDHRPLGCRLFYCERRSAGLQGPMYEKYLKALKAIIKKRAISYQYVEWLSGLEGMRVAKGEE